jgi:hypothetical protein
VARHPGHFDVFLIAGGGGMIYHQVMARQGPESFRISQREGEV